MTGAIAPFVGDEGKFGPAMQALNDRQRAFVVALVECGNDYTQAARLAGYKDKQGSSSIRVTAHRMAHDERIQAAMLEEARRRIRVATVRATGYLESVMDDNGADPQMRFKAAVEILNRGGMHALTEHQVTVTHTETREQKLTRMVELARVLGKDPRELLGNLADALPEDARVINGEAQAVHAENDYADIADLL